MLACCYEVALKLRRDSSVAKTRCWVRANGTALVTWHLTRSCMCRSCGNGGATLKLLLISIAFHETRVCNMCQLEGIPLARDLLL